ncbi:MAG TPA: type B 50S ribosomal protein L31 [Myxococcales bacterium]|nr:type B 50S ribosomal protein L31 [Myxococcales bacterium]
MKPDIHPELYPVLFHDSSTGKEWQSRSTMKTNESRDIDGVSHYVVRLDISSASHPFFTGRQRLVDTEGRIDRFKRKWGA